MVDRIEYLAGEVAAVFMFSLIFGGFLIIPLFVAWFYWIWKACGTPRFLGVWIPLAVVAVCLFLVLLWHLHSVNEGYGHRFEDSGGGPIAPFPNISIPAVIFPMMLIFSSCLSPILLVFVWRSWRWTKAMNSKGEDL